MGAHVLKKLTNLFLQSIFWRQLSNAVAIFSLLFCIVLSYIDELFSTMSSIKRFFIFFSLFILGFVYCLLCYKGWSKKDE